MFQSNTISDESLPKRQRVVLLIATLTLLILSAGVRFVASQDNFWFDEIWSWEFANQAKSFWQIATQVRHDNNHILNTWIIHCFPAETDWRLFRLPAVLAGIGTVALASLSGWRRSPCEGLTALALTGSSFVLIEYSSEARGYAYLLFFTMLCVWLLEEVSKRRTWWCESLFGISAGLGLLAHFSFLTAWLGLIAWSTVAIARRDRYWPARIASLIRLHAVPFCTLAGLAAFNGGMTIGGGDRLGLGRVIVQAASLAVGGPDNGWGAKLACVITLGIGLAGLLWLLRSGEPSAWFWGGAAFSLGLILAFTGHEVVYVRYFLIVILGILVLLGRLLALVWQAGIAGRLVYLAVMGLITFGNASHLGPFLKFGRGGYEAAVSTLLAESQTSVIGIASDHDFRNTKVLAYYLGRRADQKHLTYYPKGKWPQRGPDWVILHTFQQPPDAPPGIRDSVGNAYLKKHEFRYAGLSGWNWILYKRE